MRQQFQRAWAFGRHIPPSKLARRASLSLRHRMSDLRGPQRLRAPDVRLRDALPAPIFPWRNPEAICTEGADLIFRFLGQEIRFSAGDIDWTAPGSGAEHQLWRMNLHYMEYLEEANDELFAAMVSSWLDKNADLQPKAWSDGWNAYALSIRVVVWMQQLALRSGLAPGLRARMADSLARQLHYLSRNLETDIGGNHLIKNIKALLWAAAAFEGKAADSWRCQGLRLLQREQVTQILNDGIHYERSPSYHAQVFADLLECRSVLQTPLIYLDDILVRMAQGIADLSHPDGYAAQFNDAGLKMAYAPELCLSALSKQGLECPTPRRSFAFRDAGYFGYRDEHLYAVIDCGPLAPDNLPAHGHGDILSFELSVGDQRVFVDQGVFEYIPGARRQRSRSARAHNTLWIEGTDQADFFGAFRFGRRPGCIEATWHATNTAAVLEGAHDGYVRALGSPIHRRRFHIARGLVVISDMVEASDRRQQVNPAEINFLLHPDIDVKQDGDRLLLAGPSGPCLTMSCNNKLRADPAVWWPDMGAERPTRRITARVNNTAELVETRLTIYGDIDTIRDIPQGERLLT